MNDILTPDAKAFLSATYLPVDDRFGLNSIKTVLNKTQSDFEKKAKKYMNYL